jgi:4a-hydroxytetrahydrobiopterin dehydratase
MSKLTDDQRDAALKELDDWTSDGDAIVRQLRFKDFGRAMEFVNQVAEIAEEQRHHPDIDILYNHVTLRLSSHDVGGVTARDVVLAQAINRLA